MKTLISLAALWLICIYITPAQAALTGTVTITGAVPTACAIIVLPAVGASSIMDISLGDTNRLVATVTETCNDPDGYTVSVAGTNSGDHTGLFIDTVSLDSHPFTINYNGSSVPSGGVVTNTTAPGIGVSKPVRITYGSDNTLTSTAAFTYVEILTFTIAAK